MRSSWHGRDLGTRTISYTERDAIIYALSLGARADEYDLVDETILRVLPTFALTFGQWAADLLGHEGAFDTSTALHGAQTLDIFQPLPRAGSVEVSAHVSSVWDKGKAALFDIDVESEYFLARWSLYAPGAGDFGGERGSRSPSHDFSADARLDRLVTQPEQAALYRLNGDYHRIHIDPDAAQAIGAPRPILHGLCTMGAAVLVLARSYNRHPADLRHLEGRFSAPVLPGGELVVRSEGDTDELAFEVGLEQPFAIVDGALAFNEHTMAQSEGQP